MRPLVLILSDTPARLARLTAQLERTRHFQTKGFSTAASAMSDLAATAPDALVCDLEPNGKGGLECLRRIRSISPDLPLVVLARPEAYTELELVLAGAAAVLAEPDADVSALVVRAVQARDPARVTEVPASAAARGLDPRDILRDVIGRPVFYFQRSVLRSGALANVPGRGGGDARDCASVRLPLGLTLDEVERCYIEATLQETGGSVQRAAAMLGITRKVLWQRRKRLGLLDPEAAG